MRKQISTEIVGKRFGRLEVLSVMENNPQYVTCKCDCGNICVVKVYNLTKKCRPTKSCGCLRSEAARKNIKANSICNNEINKKFGVPFHLIENKTKRKDNKTGYTGVYYIENVGKYKAYIGLNRKLHHIGVFNNIKEAIEARERAEKELFEPLIAQKNAFLAGCGI